MKDKIIILLLFCMVLMLLFSLVRKDNTCEIGKYHLGSCKASTVGYLDFRLSGCVLNNENTYEWVVLD